MFGWIRVTDERRTGRVVSALPTPSEKQGGSAGRLLVIDYPDWERSCDNYPDTGGIAERLVLPDVKEAGVDAVFVAEVGDRDLVGEVPTEDVCLVFS